MVRRAQVKGLKGRRRGGMNLKLSSSLSYEHRRNLNFLNEWFCSVKTLIIRYESFMFCQKCSNVQIVVGWNDDESWKFTKLTQLFHPISKDNQLMRWSKSLTITLHDIDGARKIFFSVSSPSKSIIIVWLLAHPQTFHNMSTLIFCSLFLMTFAIWWGGA